MNFVLAIHEVQQLIASKRSKCLVGNEGFGF